MLFRSIVSFRLPQSISYWEVDQVKSLDVEIRTNTRVGVDISAMQLIKDYDAVILAIGMSNVPKLGIEGEELAEVYDAIDFVKATKTEAITNKFIGKKLVVIGAGNTAIDAATCSVRLGAEEAGIIYRRSQAEMTAYDFEYEFAKQEGVRFHWLTNPTRIVADGNGQVTGIECVKMELKEAGEDGRKRPIPIVGSEFTIPVDGVIRAIGQSRYVGLIEQFNIEHDGGVVKLTGDSFKTSNEKVYACGDVIFGKGQGEAMVVSAAQQGKKTAYEIDEILMSKIGRAHD